MLLQEGAELGDNGCSPTPVALTLILAPITITLTATLIPMQACHSNKLAVWMYVRAVGCGWMGVRLFCVLEVKLFKG